MASGWEAGKQRNGRKTETVDGDEAVAEAADSNAAAAKVNDQPLRSVLYLSRVVYLE